MLRIAICDDEKLFRENIKKYVLKYLSEKDISSEIDMFNSGKELLGLGTDLLGYNIIFLDINMDEIDGIMTAHKIREYSMDIYIVFVTAYVNYSLEGYKVDATRYLLKNTINFDESIYECMDTILHKMNYIVLKKYFKFNECEKNVQVDRILYIESRLHKLEFHIMEDKVLIYTLYATLNDMIILSVKNTCNQMIIYHNNEIATTKMINQDEHGVGIKNIIRIVEKYNGEYVIQNDEDQFYFSIIIPL